MPKIAPSLTVARIKTLQPINHSSFGPVKPKRYEIRDGSVRGLEIHVLPSGAKRWYFKPKHPGKRYLGDEHDITLGQARDRANEMRQAAQKGKLEPVIPQQQEPDMTLGQFIDRHYKQWSRSRNKTSISTIKRLEDNYRQFYDTPLVEIHPMEIEKLQNKKPTSDLRLRGRKVVFQHSNLWGVSYGSTL